MPPIQLTLKPAPGLVVRDPTTRQPLAAEGEAKVLDTYWHRRLEEGDVTFVDEPASAAKRRVATTPATPA